MTDNYFDITINGDKRMVKVNQTASREIVIDNHSYIVPSDVVNLLREMADEIKAQQERRIATDEQINRRIDARVDKMLKALAAHNMLAKTLKSEYPLPPNMEISGGGTWTFADEARIICRQGLKNEYGDDLADEIGSQGNMALAKHWNKTGTR